MSSVDIANTVIGSIQTAATILDTAANVANNEQVKSCFSEIITSINNLFKKKKMISSIVLNN